VELTADEQAMLNGEAGAGTAMAMRLVLGLARVLGAPSLIEIRSAHVDSCLYHGRAGLDYAHRLADLGATVVVPTTLNVGSLDLLHPGLVRTATDHEREVAINGRALMEAYRDLGCRPTFTCAPYQLPGRPGLGEHVAWAESNAIVFANSVLGARTDRYGDFFDIAAALTGRAPYAGLHRSEHRRGQLVFDCTQLPQHLLRTDLAYPLLGYLVGARAGTRVPVLTGWPAEVTEDQLKAFGAAAASSGGVALFHAVGVTPEADTLDAALHGQAAETVVVSADDLDRARAELCTVSGGPLDALSIGTPHASYAEATRLAELLDDGPPLHPRVACYLSTDRTVYTRLRDAGVLARLETAGVQVVVDTCTYVTRILSPSVRVVMTTSGKWAHYAPGNLGVDVVLGSLEECVASGRTGRVTLTGGWARQP
jgi:predicted aconitase